MKQNRFISSRTTRLMTWRRISCRGIFCVLFSVLLKGTHAEIPQDIKLWCLDDTSIGRENFHLFTDHYTETNEVQTFELFEGDVSTSDKSTALLPFSASSIPHRIHARLEVFETDKWYPGNEWQVMKGTWHVDTDIDLICIAQLKENNEEHPQIMVHIRDGERITYSPYTRGARTVGTGLHNKPFELMIRSNGQTEEVYFNGVKQYSGVPYRNSSDTRNYFRWGLYSNIEMTHDASLTVSDLYVGPEADMPRETYLETNGVIVIDAEAQLRTTDWETETSIGDFLGTGYHRGTADHFNDPGIGVITYPVKVGTSGRYQLQWRSRIGQGTVSTEHNDSWARMTDTDKNPIALRPNSNTVEGSSQWAKVYMNQTSTWHWQASNVDNDPHSLSWDLEAGVLYHFQISVRSAEYCIDRIVLWDHARQNLANKTTGALPNATALEALPLSITDRPAPPPSPSPTSVIFSNRFSADEGFSDGVSLNGIDGWSSVTAPDWLAGNTGGAGCISCVGNAGDVRAAHALGGGFTTHSNLIECAVDFSILGAPGDYTSGVDLFSIGATSSEAIASGGPAGIRVGMNAGGTFTARGRLGGTVGPYATLENSVSGNSNATIWLRLSIDPSEEGVVQAEYSFDNFATTESALFAGTSTYGNSSLYFQITAEDASKNGGSGIAINSISVKSGLQELLPDSPYIVLGPIGESIGFAWSNDLFKVQSRTNLVAGDWADVPGATNSPFVITPADPGEYYRLILQ